MMAGVLQVASELTQHRDYCPCYAYTEQRTFQTVCYNPCEWPQPDTQRVKLQSRVGETVSQQGQAATEQVPIEQRYEDAGQCPKRHCNRYVKFLSAGLTEFKTTTDCST